MHVYYFLPPQQETPTNRQFAFIYTFELNNGLKTASFLHQNEPLMFQKQKRRMNGSLQAGSMADIAFLLLIFFLVTTTIIVDQGLPVRLPPWSDQPPQEAPDRNVLAVKLNAQDELFVENGRIALPNLKETVKDFLLNPEQRPGRPSAPNKAVISLQHDRGTTYAAYLRVYDALLSAYRELWQAEADRRYGKTMDVLSEEQQNSIRRSFPMVISEAEPTAY